MSPPVRRITDHAAIEQITERVVTSSMAGQEDDFLELLERHKTILFKIANVYSFVIVLASWLLAVLYVRKSATPVPQLLEAIARKRFKK
jgi:hypothetical protein